MNDDLASGFQAVDRAGDFERFSSCLTLVESLPFFAEVKRASYERLGAGPGRRILDVGCGLGNDAAALAAMVAPGGSVVGVDTSRGMIDEARKRHEAVSGLSFEVADAASLPFADASFDACRIDRVLQHIADPAPAVAEMVRVLRPGGVLVAYDNDWETLTITPGDRATTRAILNAWCDRFPSGWIGRNLAPLLHHAGLVDIITTPHTLLITDFPTAERLYELTTTAQRLATTGKLAKAEADRWMEGLQSASRTASLFSSLTAFLASGLKLNLF